jgi:hypothetical protein
VPVAMADALKEHIAQCPKHPMSKLRTVALRKAVADHTSREQFAEILKEVEHSDG